MIEVLVDGQFAYACTNTHSEEAIHNTAKKAEELAKKASLNKLYSFTTSVRPKAVGNYTSPFKLAPSNIPTADFVDILVDTTNILKVSDKIVNTIAHAMIVDRTATAGEGTETQTRTNGSPFTQQGLELLDRDVLKATAEIVGKEALELLKAEECPSGIFDLVLAPDQLYLQVHESIGHPLELDRILGDERNYAGWSFVKPSDFGMLQYGSSLLNVTFDPFVESEAASYAFDDVGNKATREYLIKDGLLMRGLGSLESQERLKLQGVANARLETKILTKYQEAHTAEKESRTKLFAAYVVTYCGKRPTQKSFNKHSGLRAPSISTGSLQESEILKTLDTGRITGMTRYGCFWVEDGKIVSPIKDMRFDETLYHFWGEGLLSLTDESYLIAETDTYDQRSVGGSLVPGMLRSGLKKRELVLITIHVLQSHQLQTGLENNGLFPHSLKYLNASLTNIRKQKLPSLQLLMKKVW
eukprot:gene14576-14700_t